jgi:hypothetical protein
MEHEEVVIDERFPAEEEQIEPFDWGDYLYESWLEKCLENEKRKLAEAGI